jgi:hypothetical protein
MSCKQAAGKQKIGSSMQGEGRKTVGKHKIGSRQIELACRQVKVGRRQVSRT